MLRFFAEIFGFSFNTLSKNIAECHIIIYGSDCGVNQGFPVSVSPVNMQTIFQRHAANQFTGATAISLTEWMDDVQFGHRLRQILNLLFFILFGKQLLGVNGFEHPLLILGQSGLAGRTSCRPC